MNRRAEGAAVTDRTEPAEFASIAAEALPEALSMIGTRTPSKIDAETPSTTDAGTLPLIDAATPWMFDALGQTDDEHDWQERALCAQTDPEAFFPEKGGSTREAKRICSGCEVRAECLEFALAHDERFGIWGGLSERERRRLKRRAS
jgi:WhiB family transcriptional regulator, redox-sensing transcriptional regulator